MQKDMEHKMETVVFGVIYQCRSLLVLACVWGFAFCLGHAKRPTLEGPEDFSRNLGFGFQGFSSGFSILR